jgi:hypothetical protein
MMEARMRKSLLALILAGAAPLALATAPSQAAAGPAVLAPKAFDAPSAVTRVDYYRRHHYRGYRTYYRGPAYSYYAPRAYYRAPAYYAPPVVYYPPPVVVYYPPPVVYGTYPVAPYRYGEPSAAYYGGDYSDW